MRAGQDGYRNWWIRGHEHVPHTLSLGDCEAQGPATNRASNRPYPSADHTDPGDTGAAGSEVCPLWYGLPVRIPLVIWGTGGHARVVADIVRLGADYELLGFLDDVYPDRHRQRFCDAPVLGGKEQLDKLKAQGIRHVIVAFGDNDSRKRIATDIVAGGFILGRAVHPRATVAADVRIGAGTVVMAGAVLNPNATLGESVIVNTCASVDHDCVLGNAVHLSPGAHLAGRVRVGDESWIGLGAVVLEGLNVGERTIVGAGAVVTRDLPANVVAYGVPAKVIRSRASTSEV
jgi:sugar O-acyltransferase (sialic acid O-acetyltransferase NeuD family)